MITMTTSLHDDHSTATRGASDGYQQLQLDASADTFASRISSSQQQCVQPRSAEHQALHRGVINIHKCRMLNHINRVLSALSLSLFCVIHRSKSSTHFARYRKKSMVKQKRQLSHDFSLSIPLPWQHVCFTHRRSQSAAKPFTNDVHLFTFPHRGS